MGSRRVLGAAALGAVVLATGASGSGSSYARGVDVSHWNGAVQWTRVARAGYSFAFAEATKGRYLTDPAYTDLRAGATAAKLKFGAYHYALPSGRTPAAVVADAVAEADRFAAVAQLRPGDLLPVLDLERTGKLSPPALIAWTAAWLREAQRKIGVRPMIYASPYFWRVAMADTPLFATRGSPLWLARWTRSSSPGVPAANWAGGGWTFWQWTDCAHVPGIRHCADGDRFKAPDVSPLLLRKVAAPVIMAPPTIMGLAQPGQMLTSTTGTWAGRSPLAFTYVWNRCDADGANCAPVVGALSQTYVLTEDDVGSTLTVTVTARNDRGSASSTSAPTAVVWPPS
jgi:lysozyme